MFENLLSRIQRAAALLLFVVLMANCGGESNNSPEQDYSGKYGFPCLPDGSCETGLFCLNGICEYPVTPDGDVESADLDETEPEPEYECRVNSQCSAGRICIDHECVLPPNPEEDKEPEEEIEESGEVDEDLPYGQKLRAFPNPIDFGAVEVSGSSTRTVTLENYGEEPLQVFDLTIENPSTVVGNFTFPNPVSSQFSLEPSEKVVLDLRFERHDLGDPTSYLRIRSDDVVSEELRVPFLSTYEGRVEMEIEPDPLDFTVVPLGSTGTSNLTIKNTATGDQVGSLKVSSVLFTQDGEIFALGEGAPALPLSMPAGDQIVLPLTATPGSPGLLQGRLLIFHNDPEKTYPYELPLSVVGGVPTLAIEPNIVTFGAVPVDEGRTMRLTLRNEGAVPLEMPSAPELGSLSSSYFTLNFDPDNDGTPNVPTTLNPTESTEISVNYLPEAVGNHQGSLFVHSNANNGQDIRVDLLGSGIPPALSISPGLIEFDCVQVGTFAERALTVLFEGEGSVTISNALISGSQGAFSVYSHPTFPATLNQGNSIEILIRYTPEFEVGQELGELLIVIGEEDPINYSIQLTGCGIASRIEIDFDSDSAFLNVQKLPKPFGELTPDEQAKWITDELVGILSQGSAPLHISEIILEEVIPSSTWFLEEITPALVAPGESTQFGLSWAPNVMTDYTIHIKICSDAINASSQTGVCPNPDDRLTQFSLMRRPIEPMLDITPSLIDFGAVAPGMSEEEVVYIKDDRLAPLHVETISILGSPDFTIAGIETIGVENSGDGWHLEGESGEIIMVTVRYQNNTAGAQSGALLVRHNDKDANLAAPMVAGNDYPEINVLLLGNGGDNHPPVSIVKSPAGVPEGPVGVRSVVVPVDTPVVLDGASSYDPDAGDAISGYAWTIDQTSGFVWLLEQTGQFSGIRFNTSGLYTVRLDVTDSYGAVSAPTPFSKVEIAVQGDPVPVATERDTGDTSVTALVRAPLLLDGTQSYDPDGTVVGWRWYIRELPDGTDQPLSSDPQPSVTFEEGGKYFAISLEVIDNDGRVSPNRSEIQVEVRENDRVRIEMQWTGGGDVNLHYLRQGGSFGGNGDCHAGDAQPDWTPYQKGHPQLIATSSNGSTPEILKHNDPGDGTYTITADYATASQDCKYVQKCEHYEDNCAICGCACWDWLCYIQPLDCCASCDECVNEWVCTPKPALVTFKIYVNDSSTPTWTLSGEAYRIPNSPGQASLSLQRVNGKYLSPAR